MFSIGQHVIHPGQGVCTVVGFRDDTPQPMLLLETKQGHAQTILMYPVAQADRLHAAISQQDAEHLLSHYDELECDTFTERNSSLEEPRSSPSPSRPQLTHPRQKPPQRGQTPLWWFFRSSRSSSIHS